LDTQAPLFSPRKAMEQRWERQRAARKSKVQPSQVCRKRPKPKRQWGAFYNSRSYALAVARGCERAGGPHWHPHQLRHAYGTEVRRRFGLETTQAALGHTQANVSEIYAQADVAQAVRVAAEVG